MQKLFFIGGWTRTEKSYNRLWKCMPEYYDVLFLPCYEVTDKCSTNEYADYIAKFLERHNIDKCIVAGHSLGGGLALEFASKYPGMVDRLIIVDSSGIANKQKFNEKMRNIAKTQFTYFGRKMKENVTTTGRIISRPIKNFKSLVLAYSHDIQEEMKKIVNDTLILWGEYDHIFSPAQAEKIHKLIPNSKLQLLSNMDHDWIIHEPKLFWNNIAQMDNEYSK